MDMVNHLLKLLKNKVNITSANFWMEKDMVLVFLILIYLLGAQYYSDGSSYEGEWKDGMKDG